MHAKLVKLDAKKDVKVAAERAKVAELEEEVAKLQTEVAAAGIATDLVSLKAADYGHLLPDEAGKARIKVHALQKAQAKLRKEEQQLGHAEAVAEKAHKTHGTEAVEVVAKARIAHPTKAKGLLAHLEEKEKQKQQGAPPGEKRMAL
jgi:hypothetical protein